MCKFVLLPGLGDQKEETYLLACHLNWLLARSSTVDNQGGLIPSLSSVSLLDEVLQGVQ